jgi:hypothetical protein
LVCTSPSLFTETLRHLSRREATPYIDPKASPYLLGVA